MTPPMPQRIVSQSGMLSLLPGATNLPSRPMTIPAIITPTVSTGTPFAVLPAAQERKPTWPLVGGNDHPAPLGIREHQSRRVAGQSLGHGRLHVVPGLARVDDQLTTHVLNADLDLHRRASSVVRPGVSPCVVDRSYAAARVW